MKIRVLAVGHKMPPWVDEAVHDYARRMPPHADLSIEAIKPGDRRRGVERAMTTEAERIRARLKPADQIVVLDERGKPWSTRDLAGQLQGWLESGGDAALLVGGADGLDPTLKAEHRRHWSLSRLTLPHPLVRVVLAEQVYRAWSLLNNHPYHRE